MCEGGEIAAKCLGVCFQAKGDVCGSGCCIQGIYLFLGQFGCRWRNIKHVWNIFTVAFNHAARSGVNHGTK